MRVGEVTVKQSLSFLSVEFHIGGLRKCAKFGCRGHTFGRLWVTVDFDDISLQKYGQYIIQSLSFSSVEFNIGGLRKMCQIWVQRSHFWTLVGYC